MGYGLCLSSSLHLTIWSPPRPKTKEAFPLHAPSLTLFLISACDLLSAQCSLLPLLSSPLPLYLHSLARPQNTENTGNTKVSPSWKNEKHNLCVTFYKQIWLTLAELDGLFSQFIGWWFSEDCLTPWLPVCCQMSGWENSLFSLTAPTPSSSCTF